MIITQTLFNINHNNFNKHINKSKKFGSYSPAEYLYSEIINFKGWIFTKKYLILIYVALKAWNMNSRAAKLVSFKDFRESIYRNRKLLRIMLQFHKINDIRRIMLNFNGTGSISNINQMFQVLESLFNNLSLTVTGTKLVTFSKVMHFMFPKLIVPIDRKYTLTFFRNSVYVPTSMSAQFKYFKLIHISFFHFASVYDLSNYINHNLPFFATHTKIIDNLIIGSLS